MEEQLQQLLAKAKGFNLKGLNHRINPFILREGECLQLLNLQTQPIGAKTTRPGYTTFLNNPDSKEVKTLISFDGETGVRSQLRFSGGKYYRHDTHSTSLTWGTGVSWGGQVSQMNTVGDQTGDKMDQANDWTAQSFQIPTSSDVGYVAVYLEKTGTPGDVTIEIRNDDSGKPGTTVVDTATIDEDDILEDPGNWVWAKFTSASLTASTTYWLTVRAPSADASNYYYWYCSSSDDAYGNGSRSITTDGGTNWTAESRDSKFIISLDGETGKVGHASLDRIMLFGDGVYPTKSFDGYTFEDVDLAPKGRYFAEFQRSIYIAGSYTSPNTVFASSSGEAKNWSTVAPNDSVSFDVPGRGVINGLFTSVDRLIITKTSGQMFKYDGYKLYEVTTDLAPTSPYSVDNTEDFWFWLNNLGVYVYNGNRPMINSNPVQDYFYNDSGDNLDSDVLTSAPGVCYRYKFMLPIGDVTDMYGNSTTDAILVYDYPVDEWSVWKFADYPVSFVRHKDSNDIEQLYFADDSGQCYLFGNGETSDNGKPIETIMETFLHFGTPEQVKQAEYFWAFTNPGCEAKIQIATTDSFSNEEKKWEDITQVTGGVNKARLSERAQGRFLFVKVTDSSKDKPYTYYGHVISAENLGDER